MISVIYLVIFKVMKLGEAMREEIKWSLNLIIKVIIHIEKKM